ncbi:MAG: hypothetical protein OEL66_04510 [Desulfobulbaceae bacterium]|nr:hypothetical protein [Desulfobulbaceae bacterium]
MGNNTPQTVRATADWQQMLADAQRVGIVGVPPLEMIRFLHERRIAIDDLDAMLIKADLELVTVYLPRVYCAILRTVVLNALHLKLDAVIVDVGPGKCDAAFHVATILEESLDIPIIRTENRDHHPFGTPISEGRLPLMEKLLKITEGVKSPLPDPNPPEPCQATAGFWGVPPRDFSILNLFPDTTHVYGWSRCMETKPRQTLTLRPLSTRRSPPFSLPSPSAQKPPWPVS